MERVKSTLLIAAFAATVAACGAKPAKRTTAFETQGPVAAETTPAAAPVPAPTVAPIPAPPAVVTHATCEAAAAQAVAVLNPIGTTVETATEECHTTNWSAELRDCYAAAQTAGDAQPCNEMYDAELTQVALDNLDATLLGSAAADRCYDDADVQGCIDACNDGFAWACVHSAFTAATDDLADQWLVRSCILGEALAYANASDLPLDAGELNREVQGGLTACRTLAKPLIDDPMFGDAALYVHAEQACIISVQLTDGSAADTCRDFGLVADAFGMFDWGTWAYQHACAADNADACELANASA